MREAIFNKYARGTYGIQVDTSNVEDTITMKARRIVFTLETRDPEYSTGQLRVRSIRTVPKTLPKINYYIEYQGNFYKVDNITQTDSLTGKRNHTVYCTRTEVN